MTEELGSVQLAHDINFILHSENTAMTIIIAMFPIMKMFGTLNEKSSSFDQFRTHQCFHSHVACFSVSLCGGNVGRLPLRTHTQLSLKRTNEESKTTNYDLRTRSSRKNNELSFHFFF